jgi:hypothetical protein
LFVFYLPFLIELEQNNEQYHAFCEGERKNIIFKITIDECDIRGNYSVSAKMERIAQGSIIYLT